MFMHNRPPYDLNSIGVNLVYTENPEPPKKIAWRTKDDVQSKFLLLVCTCAYLILIYCNVIHYEQVCGLSHYTASVLDILRLLNSNPQLPTLTKDRRYWRGETWGGSGELEFLFHKRYILMHSGSVMTGAVTDMRECMERQTKRHNVAYCIADLPLTSIASSFWFS